MDWSDYCMESEISLETEEGQRVVQSLIDLWYSFVKFEASFNYFKKAADLFDKALDDNVVGMTAEIYRLYADYFVSRGKPGLATKGFQRGLTNAKLSTTESYKLWLYFADFVKESKNFHVESMQILYQMLYDQLPAVDRDRLSAAPPDAEVENIRKTLIVRTKESLVTGSNVVSTSSTTSMRSVQQDVAESKEGEGFFMQSPVKATPITSGATAPPVAPPVVKPSNPLLSSVDIDELETNISGGLSAEQLIRLFRRRPPMLFVAPNKVSVFVLAMNAEHFNLYIFFFFFVIIIGTHEFGYEWVNRR